MSISKSICIWLGSAVALTFFCQSASAAIITKTPNNLGLLAYWGFEDATGSRATDFSGNGNGGVLAGATGTNNLPQWLRGRVGRALSFDGTDDAVDFGTLTSSNGLSSLTVTTWVKVTTAKDFAAVIYKGDNTANRWAIASSGSGVSTNTDVLLLMGTGSNSYAYTTNNILTTGVWHHLVMVFDGSLTGNSNRLKLYVDGAQQSLSFVGTIPSTTNTDTSFHKIGHYNEQNYLAGVIDEVRVYSRPFAATEITRLYGTGITERRAASELGLVGYWSFDDATGTKATDFSGNGNIGTLTNMEAATDWVSSKRGKGLLFDGADEYVQSSHISSLDGVSAMSASFWVKPTTLGELKIMIGQFSNTDGLGMMVQTGNASYGSANDIILSPSNGNANNFGYTTNAPLANGSWYNIVMAFDGTQTGNANRLKLYINGVQQSLSFSGTIAATVETTAHDFRIGAAGAGDALGRYFNGVIDEVRIYNRALSLSEVSALYQLSSAKLQASQNSRLTSGLVGLWSFNGSDMVGTTALDRSGQGNNGTLTSGARVDAGKVGQGVRFDGVDDRVVIPHSSAIAGGTGSQTFSMWAYIDSFPDGTSVTLMSKMYSLASSEISYSMFIGADTAFYFQTTNGANFKLYTAATTPFTAREWHHIAFQHTWGSGASSKLYVDGALVSGSWTTGTGDDTYTDQSVGIELGRLNHSNTLYEHWLKGVVDEFRIYNRMLTAAEIRSLYLLGR